MRCNVDAGRDELCMRMYVRLLHVWVASSGKGWEGLWIAGFEEGYGLERRGGRRWVRGGREGKTLGFETEKYVGVYDAHSPSVFLLFYILPCCT